MIPLMAGFRTYVGTAYYDSQQPVTMVMWWATKFCFPFLVSGSHVSAFTFGWNGGWPCTDGAHRYGGRPSGLPPRRPFFLDLERAQQEQWSSVGALLNQLPQVITYHRYASLRGTSSLETGVVLCPHVSGLHQDRKVFVPYL